MKKIQGRFILAAAAAVLALLGTAGPMLAAAVSGGTFNIPTAAISSGGVRSTGGSLVNYSAIGGYGTVMTGGTLTMTPGTLASVKGARLDMALAHAYPTPFVPSRGHIGITFTALPKRVTIQIFSMSGRLVRTLSKDDSTDALFWTPVNAQGSPLASGVYVFTIADTGTRKRHGKIMIIR